MKPWNKFLHRLGSFPPQAGSICLDLEAPYRELLLFLAGQERRLPGEMAAALLRDALSARQEAEYSLGRWRSLSPREQEIAALTCLSCTNRQIASRLGISPETVKTHLHNLLAKFDLRSKSELRQALSGWDFRSWR